MQTITSRLLQVLLPEKAVKRLSYVGSVIVETYDKFLMGQMIEAVIVGILVFIAYSLTGLPYAALTGVLAGVLSFIPYIGPFSACALGAIFIFTDSPWKALLSIAVFQVVQLIGLLNNPSQNEEEMELVRQFAKVYGASCHNLFAPFILDDKQARQVLNRVAAVGKTIELAKQANVILSSVGNFDLKDKRILWNSYLGKEEKLRLSQQGAVGLFFGRYYDRDGRILDTELHNKIFGLEVEEIVNKEQVITVAQGQKSEKP